MPMRTAFTFAMICLAGGLVPSLAIWRTWEQLSPREKELVAAQQARIDQYEASWPKGKDWSNLSEAERDCLREKRAKMGVQLQDMYKYCGR
ncbi:hypothetical protein F5148DRAFT_1207179 [Russula earlei]|uniref:Uncharacterized protein n=1 Tax=Russula earlei TaxID=71964 RepID=A0ACC0U8Q0_9AGAM|nr:hypothetical protein F5148DRAFT_1207179 [Russula earlei]